MTSHQNDADKRLGCFNMTSTKLLEDLVMAVDIDPMDEDERIQAARDLWFTKLTLHHA